MTRLEQKLRLEVDNELQQVKMKDLNDENNIGNVHFFSEQ